MRKQLIISISIILLMASGSLCFAAGKDFKDLPKNHWAYEKVQKLVDEKIIDGYPDNTFKPEAHISHGEFLKLVYTVVGEIENEDQNQKTDITNVTNGGSSPHWASTYYKAYLGKLYQEDDISQAALNQPIKRELMALAVSKVLKSEADKITDEDFEKVQSKIKDVQKSNYDYHIINSVCLGVLSGYPGNRFKPEGHLTRAEASTVIVKLKEKIDAMKNNPAKEPENKPEPEEDEFQGAYSIFKETDVVVMTKEEEHGYESACCLIAIYKGNEANAERSKRIKEALVKNIPEHADAIFKNYNSFIKKLTEGKQGLRKEYYGKIPVLMDCAGYRSEIMIKRPGKEGAFWEVKPGEVYEEFF